MELRLNKELKMMGNKENDRAIWCKILTNMANPVLLNMQHGTLHQKMEIETGPIWDNRDIELGYLGCFCRLMAGISPWLSLPDSDSPESRERERLLEISKECCCNAVDPSNPDKLKWSGHNQYLVEGAYMAESYLKNYEKLWKQLDNTTQKRYIDVFLKLREIIPYNNNWLLFSAVIETFLNKAEGIGDNYRISNALHKIDRWYVGDGWYSDGPEFSFDYYNSFVIHPMLLECLSELDSKNFEPQLIEGLSYDKILKRTQRFAVILERLISPEGTFPLVGRSITYRTAFLQPLAYLAWKESLPGCLPVGQVRSAMNAVINNLFERNQNYNDNGFLCLGFNGHQREITNKYTNNGSLYMASLAFLPLGLPEENSFWTEPEQEWTNKRGWTGKAFERDDAYKEGIIGISVKRLIKERIKMRMMMFFGRK